MLPRARLTRPWLGKEANALTGSCCAHRLEVFCNYLIIKLLDYTNPIVHVK